jgi:hypothetical protein
MGLATEFRQTLLAAPIKSGLTDAEAAEQLVALLTGLALDGKDDILRESIVA